MGSQSAAPAAVAAALEPRPRLIAFDLDYTLWPFWVDTHVDPPFRQQRGEVVDAGGRRVRPFPEATSVLQKLAADGYVLAAASRTGEVKGARQLLRLFHWHSLFSHTEIYPGCKKAHFSRIRRLSGVEYSDMLFFDDEPRNVRDLQELGVACVLVRRGDGVSHKVVTEGLAQFAAARAKKPGLGR